MSSSGRLSAYKEETFSSQGTHSTELKDSDTVYYYQCWQMEQKALVVMEVIVDMVFWDVV